MPNSDLLSIQSYVKQGIGYIHLSGRLVAETRFDFKKEVREMSENGCSKVIVNLGPLEYIDSAGMAALIGAWKQLRDAGGELVTAELSSSIQSLFEVSSMEKFFAIFPAVSSATEYFRNKSASDGAQ